MLLASHVNRAAAFIPDELSTLTRLEAGSNRHRLRACLPWGAWSGRGHPDTSLRRHRRRRSGGPGRVSSSHSNAGRSQVCSPTQADGWRQRPAIRPSTGSDASPPVTRDMPRQPCSVTPSDHRGRRGLQEGHRPSRKPCRAGPPPFATKGHDAV